MTNQTKYIVQGAAISLLFAVTVIAFQSSLFDRKIKTGSAVDTFNHTKAIYAITNKEGQKLFNENCSSCHALLKTDGGQLFGVEERIKDKALLREWIRSSSKVLHSGNAYFNSQVKQYGVMMPDFPNLTNKQIDSILDYINQEELMHHYDVSQ